MKQLSLFTPLERNVEVYASAEAISPVWLNKAGKTSRLVTEEMFFSYIHYIE